MFRRAFLSLLPAGLLSAFAGRVKGPPAYDPFAADRGPDGECLCRVYRQDPTGGNWYEIDRSDVRAGDRIIHLGLDGKRLWRAEAMTVVRPWVEGGRVRGVDSEADLDTDLTVTPSPPATGG